MLAGQQAARVVHVNGQDGIAGYQQPVAGAEERDVPRRMTGRGYALPVRQAGNAAAGSNA